MTLRLGLATRRQQRGFTLIELMVVVVIIAVLAAISVPLFVAKMRERRAQQTALQLAGLYREARMRALGRGASVRVFYDGTTWQVQEGVEGQAAAAARGDAACQSLPTSGCLTNPWNGTASRNIASFNPADVSSEIVATLADGSTALDVCFTPLGRTFERPSAAATYRPLTRVVGINVKRGNDGLRRTVIVLPNGTARLGL
ncbi:MAG TPA: prepilin-type N-terminal cleavage/methylation domain-containing protein [Polyangiaceae bacterium]|nr:prepilin-type N-terminal cleavage/methylation domain-containing protein [Polyangiaceae bacterium]